MILRCTANALSLLGGGKLALAVAPPADDDWYLNLLWIERRNCLLLTHAGTLVSILLADVRAPDLRPIGPPLVDAIVSELTAEDLPSDALGDLDPKGVLLAKTARRSVLGFMNEIAFHIRHTVARQGGLERADTRALHHELQRTLHNHAGYAYPIELARERARRARAG